MKNEKKGAAAPSADTFNKEITLIIVGKKCIWNTAGKM